MQLFSQVLLGYKNKQDLDKLVHRLEENHGLLTQMAERENGCEASSELPKLLLELVSQVDECDEKQDSPFQEGTKPVVNASEDKKGDETSDGRYKLKLNSSLLNTYLLNSSLIDLVFFTCRATESAATDTSEHNSRRNS